ncbi:hypothetical protein C8J57DRAFT_1363397, partial [Mycena rebaudengoi]
MNSLEAPILLCSICSAWRTLALSSPRLWSSLTIHISFVLEKEERLAALAEWLARAGACPLSLTVVNTGMFEPAAPGYEVLMGILAKSASQWRAIKVEKIPTVCLYRLCDIHAPTLTAIDIEHDARLFGPLSWTILDGRRLRTFKIRMPQAVGKYTPNILPTLSHLSHLSFGTRFSWPGDGISGPVLVSILRNLLQLVSLQVELAPWHDTLAGDRIHLPALNSLAIVGFCPTTIPLASFLDHLVMPQLQALRIETPGFREAELDPVSFASLAERSPLLSSLSIVLSAFTNQNLLEALRLFPALETLDTIAGPDHTRFTAFPTTADLLALLRNTQPPVCPSLKNLLVRSIPVPHYDALLSFSPHTTRSPAHLSAPRRPPNRLQPPAARRDLTRNSALSCAWCTDIVNLQVL